MSKQPATPSQLADRLAAYFPPPLTPTVLEEYGLEQTASKTAELTREFLALSLFWIESALEAHYRGIGDVLVLPEVHRRLRERWTGGYGLKESDWERLLTELPDRFREYARVKNEGGSAVAVFSEAGMSLESNWVVRSEDQSQLLALMIDLIPVEPIGQLFDAYELVAPA